MTGKITVYNGGHIPDLVVSSLGGEPWLFYRMPVPDETLVSLCSIEDIETAGLSINPEEESG